ncbi:MAG: glutamyl-tRNA reductase [Salibacteraceae bacterium]
MKQFHIIALTHRNLGLDAVGKFHVEPDQQADRFQQLLPALGIREFMMLSTCNRVEFFIRTSKEIDEKYLSGFIKKSYPEVPTSIQKIAVEKARVYSGLDAIRHLFHVASSLDSLIVGEREIITQVRKAYERSLQDGMTNHFIRLAVEKAIECAKQVYTETNIATKPISVVNLGYRRLLARDLNECQRVAFIGAGQTIEAIAGNLRKFNFRDVKVFNRTRSKAVTLANNLGGKGFGLEDLSNELIGMDIIISCTGSERPIIGMDLYRSLNSESKAPKIILDLAIPTDVDAEVIETFGIDYISVESLREEAKVNLKIREKEVFRCEELVEDRLKEFEEAFRTRKLELAMAKVPNLMKEIKTNAIEKTFAKKLSSMSENDRLTALEMLHYLEKKYVALPMKIAKEVILDKDLKDSVSE